MRQVTAAILCRVSSQDQRDGGTSLETQREKGLAKASQLGWYVPEEYIIMEDWTGTDLTRPGIRKILELSASGKIQGLIIYTQDRLYRAENDGEEWKIFPLLQRFNDLGVQLEWADAAMPSRGPLASVFMFLDSWRAGRERRAIIERTARGRMKKIEMGKVFSRAAASYGYRFDREKSTLLIHEEEAKTVRLAAPCSSRRGSRWCNWPIV